jgi:hypothetical protein
MSKTRATVIGLQAAAEHRMLAIAKEQLQKLLEFAGFEVPDPEVRASLPDREEALRFWKLLLGAHGSDSIEKLHHSALSFYAVINTATNKFEMSSIQFLAEKHCIVAAEACAYYLNNTPVILTRPPAPPNARPHLQLVKRPVQSHYEKMLD